MKTSYQRNFIINEIIEQFEIEENSIPGTELSSNIFPGQEIAAIIFDGKRRLVKFKWGLVPSWLRDADKAQIHARAETITQKPFFRDSFKKRRALIVSAGYFQWKTEGKEKVPIYIRMKDGHPCLMAGVYDFTTTGDGTTAGTCAIITADSNDLIKDLNPRMPVMIEKKNMGIWLDSATEEEVLLSLLKPIGANLLELIPGRFEGKRFVASQ
jgi:putative SOS response-associated peptidase YedK